MKDHGNRSLARFLIQSRYPSKIPATDSMSGSASYYYLLATYLQAAKVFDVSIREKHEPTCSGVARACCT
jgi:hypothetical protein